MTISTSASRAPMSSLDGIPEPWKRWIGAKKLLKTPDATIVDLLVRNGHSREAAMAEVERAGSDPYLQAGEWNTQRLRKAESLLGVYRALSKLQSGAGAIERRSQVSRHEFLERYYAANRPVILQGAMKNWKAMTLWTPDYLKGVIGQEEVEIMASRESDPNYEVDCNPHRRVMRFADYVDAVYEGGETNDYYLVANNYFFKRPAVRKLMEDIEAFPEYLDPQQSDGNTFFWFGPAGTITPLHHDTINIFMAQVSGRKRVKLIPSFESEFVYNDVCVYSRVDCENPDYALWPKFREATVTDVILEPGEVLFLPVGWWHHVRAIEVSLTISFTNFLFPNQYEWQMPNIPQPPES